MTGSLIWVILSVNWIMQLITCLLPAASHKANVQTRSSNFPNCTQTLLGRTRSSSKQIWKLSHCCAVLHQIYSSPLLSTLCFNFSNNFMLNWEKKMQSLINSWVLFFVIQDQESDGQMFHKIYFSTEYRWFFYQLWLCGLLFMDGVYYNLWNPFISKQ